MAEVVRFRQVLRRTNLYLKGGVCSGSVTKGQGKQVSKKRSTQQYHHGALPQAFLEAAERILQKDGLSGLTVRAISREAGVSHTAAQHHFTDRSGILSELAAIGHLRLTDTLASHARDLPLGPPKRKALGRGYVQFAIRNPDLFRLMSRNELLDYGRPALANALQISSRALAGVFEVRAEVKSDVFTPITKAQAVAIAAGWALVHGLANLLIDGRLNRLTNAVGTYTSPEALVEDVIQLVTLELPVQQG